MRTLLLVLSGCFGLETFPQKDKAPDTEVPFTDSGPGPIDSGDHDGNHAPVADAGPDQASETGRVASLDGSGSSDADGDPLEYSWRVLSQPQGSTSSLINTTWVDPEIFLDRAGTYTIELTVSDGALDATDTVDIVAVTPNGLPEADAGPDQVVYTGSIVTLNGSGSSDPDGDALNYTWTFISKPSGSSATLSNFTTSRPSFTADQVGNYDISLVVDDGVDSSAADTVRVVAEAEGGGGDDTCGCSGEVEREIRRGNPVFHMAYHAGGIFGVPALTLLLRRRRQVSPKAASSRSRVFPPS